MGRFCFFYQAQKTLRIIDGNVGQHFPFQVDPRALETAHKFAVRNIGCAAGRINAHNPQRAEIALFLASPDISVAERFFYRFLRGAVQLRFGKKVAFGEAKCLPAVIAPAGSTFPPA